MADPFFDLLDIPATSSTSGTQSGIRTTSNSHSTDLFDLFAAPDSQSNKAAQQPLPSASPLSFGLFSLVSDDQPLPSAPVQPPGEAMGVLPLLPISSTLP